MDYMKVSEAAEKWGISARRVRVLCAEEKIEGVIRKGNLYMIPIDAVKPQDGRYNQSTLSEETIDRIVHAQNNLHVPSDSLKKLTDSMNTLEKLNTDVISTQLQEVVTSVQRFTSSIVSVMQSDAMQTVLNVGQQIAQIAASVDFRPMLKKFNEAIVPFKYISLLEELQWPIFLIDHEQLREDILNACAEKVDSERVAEIIYEYCTDEFFGAMEVDWMECPTIKDERKQILSEAFLMHKKQYYYASTSILMCQVYGVASDIEKVLAEKGLSLNKEEKENAADMFGLNPKRIDSEKGRLFQALMFTESGILLWNAMAKYMKEICFFSGQGYSDIQNHPLRNKICHGDQLEFGTKEHSLKAILVVDMLIQLAYEIERIGKQESEDN